MATHHHVTSERWTTTTWVLILVLCGALFLDGLDISMVGVALPSIGSDLNLAPGPLQWIVSGYILGYGGLLLLGGRVNDLIGKRRVFLTAVAAFAIASLLSVFITDGTLLIATRFLKGVSAAFTVPAGLSIITTTFAEGPARNKALSIYTACGASGFSMGLILGGILTEIDWRLTMLLPAPIAVLLVVLGWRVIARDDDDRESKSYDVAGAASVTGAMLVLVFTVVEAPNAGWSSTRTLLGFAVAAALLALFVIVESRTKHPLLRLGILKSSKIIQANLGAMALFGSYAGFQFIGTLYLQNALDWSPLSTALAFLPAGLIVFFGAQRTGALVNRIGTITVIGISFVAFFAAYLLFLRVGPNPSYLLVIFPTMVLIGIGFATGFPSVNMQATDGIEDYEQGVAAGLLNTSLQLGGALVLAVVSAVVSSSSASGKSETAAIVDSLQPATLIVAGVSLAGLLLSLAIGLKHQQNGTLFPAKAAAAIGLDTATAEFTTPATEAASVRDAA